MPTLTNNIPEALGQFYLGNDVYPEATQGQPTLYDAADLTTHAVIIGMTGSGKTGLGISLLEEASLDNIPVIAIDPKGDLGNLAFAFPNLAPSDFEPWIDESMAAQAGLSVEDFAKQTANNWQQGLANTYQTAERVQMLKNANRVTVYTPGSETGVPVALLGNFVPPTDSIKNDAEAYAEYIDANVAALLVLLKIESDSLAPEHIFLAQLLKTAWDNNQTLTLVDLITQIQAPPFDKIGILPLSQVFDDKSRQKLAMKLNTLLASPSFGSWLKGMPLDTGALFYDTLNKPQTSVMNIAHLSDDERLFFVTLLLSNLIGWMRRQQGTSTLRAILYMDEVFGYLPPLGNPPTKVLLLTLLKQARAFGLGIVLSTQNPVDLDYKALSNAGTWFIGRLQTAQDRERVMDGLLSASGAAGFDKTSLNDWFDKLGKRQFLLHNVHETSPVIFATRWSLSYLSGPLNKQSIAKLKAQMQGEIGENSAPSDNQTLGQNPNQILSPLQSSVTTPPALPKDVGSYFLPKGTVSDGLTIYEPQVFAYARVFFSDKKTGANTQQQMLLLTRFGEPPMVVDWYNAILSDTSFEQLQNTPHQPAKLGDLPSQALEKSTWKAWEKDCKDAIRQQQVLTLWSADGVNLYSEVGESETAFRNRLTVPLHEQRDMAIAKLRESFAKRQEALNKKIQAANEKLQQAQSEASQGWLDAGVSIGSAVLGAFMGRKTLSQSNINNVKRAMGQFGGIKDSRAEAGELEGVMQSLQAEMTALEQELQTQIDSLSQQYDPQTTMLTTIQITPKATDISILLMGVAYVPV